MSLLTEFFSNKQDLLRIFQEFAAKHKLNFLEDLKKEKNKTQFLSAITEIQFGHFLSNQASFVQKEPAIGDKTPDWLFTINGQNIIAEVLRLNASAYDQVRLDFIDNFIDKMKEIKIGAFLSFSFEDNINIDNINLDECKQIIQTWLVSKRKAEESFVLLNCIDIRFHVYTDTVNYVCFMGMGGQIKFDYRRLSAENSPLLKKANKYLDIIEKQDLPYIICIYLDFHTWFTKEDLFNYLYGFSCQDITTNPSSYSTIIKDALYYNPNYPLRNVSGILLRRSDEYTYFHNFSNSNRLNQINKEYFLKWQCPYE